MSRIYVKSIADKLNVDIESVLHCLAEHNIILATLANFTLLTDADGNIVNTPPAEAGGFGKRLKPA